jgi:hypothetical protein
MRTTAIVLLLGVVMLVGVSLPAIHGSEECPDCKLLKEKQHKETAALQQQIKELEKSARAGFDLSVAVGFIPETPRAVLSDVAAIRKYVQDELKALTRRDRVVVPAKGYAEALNGGYARAGEDGRVTVKYWNAPALPASCTLEYFLDLRSAGVVRMLEDIRRLSERVAELSK